jgi:hypothetical protein
MKNSFVFALTLLFGSLSVLAQRTVEKTERLSRGQEVFVDFKFAGDIQLQHWNQSEIKVVATVHIDDGAGNDSYSLVSEKSGSGLKIYSDFGDYFEKKGKKGRYTDCHTTTKLAYVVYLPKGIKLKVKSISGSLSAQTFEGELTTDLISGDVELANYNGPLKLKTISGNLDVVIKKAEVRAKSLTGTIYSDLEISFNSNGDHGNKVYGSINNGGDMVNMETISGNIYMRSKPKG